MLSKLIKYDIRSTWRDFAGVYLSVLLGVLILPQLLNHFGNHAIVSLVSGFLGTGIIISAIVIMIVMLFRIFHANVFSKQGYLTMTLPVSSTQIVASKLLVSTMWIVLTGIVAIAGVGIFVLSLNAVSLSGIAAEFQKILSVLDGRGVLATVLMAVGIVFSSVKEVAKLFLACAVAHLKQLGRFRVLLGILSYFVFSWIEVLIVQALSLIASLFPFAGELAGQINLINNASDIQQFISLFSGVMVVGILYSMVLIALYSFCTVAILNRKLDLN